MSKRENSNQVCTLSPKVVFFATANIHKFNEAQSILSPTGFALAMLKVKGEEIQSDSLKEIAQTAAQNAFNRTHLPIFVEDAGLFVDSVGGFPGPYAAYAYKTIQNKGILRLMQGTKERQATFKSVIAYLDETLPEPQIFEGKAEGQITETERRTTGRVAFGFDPIFQPMGSHKTFAEMTIEEKNGFSHRAKAIREFVEWRKKRPK
jgi:XTP/dITP diphosphohydrolase